MNNHVQESSIMAAMKIKSMEGGYWIQFMELSTSVDMPLEV